MKVLLTVSVFFVALLSLVPVHAHPGGHGGGHGVDPTPSPEVVEPVPAPKTLAGVLDALREQHSEGVKALESNKVADAQRVVVRLGELADAVLQRTEALPAETQREATAAAGRIKVQVDVLLEAVLGADKKKGQMAMESLLGEINTLQAFVK